MRSLDGLAADDLRHALMAHAHDLGDGLHRQAVLIRRPDGFIALCAELVGRLLQLALPVGVFLGKGRQAGFRLGCLALGTDDSEGSSALFLLIG